VFVIIPSSGNDFLGYRPQVGQVVFKNLGYFDLIQWETVKVLLRNVPGKVWTVNASRQEERFVVCLFQVAHLRLA
jgi:hypothetical protein